ncbi:MAG: SDR family NAD(P)-dependent oxidoreductase [Proteobacteria bacterium]|nr:MAG: SDR family NAD(P)-dependent oxidoreductase [Pseudomonadota bacterium]
MSHSGKVVFITGANRGIGLETAVQLGKEGLTLVLGIREKKSGEETVKALKAQGIESVALEFDVNKLEQHTKVYDYIQKTFGQLDILINNAGIMVDKAEADGSYPSSKTLSSILGSLTLHSDPKSPIYNSKAFAYNVSKTALNAFTVHLAHELKDSKIKVNSAHPGWVKTDMGGAGASLEIVDGAKTSVQLALLPDNGPTGGFFHLGDTLPW